MPCDVVQFDDNVTILETRKVALDFRSPHTNRVVDEFIAAGRKRPKVH